MTQPSNSRFNPFAIKLNKESSIKQVIAIVSGKGGVGKSFITGLLANQMNQKGFQTGILDADITGPSIGKMFGIHQAAYGNDSGGIFPAMTPGGLKIITANMLLEQEDQAIMWRGMLINNAVKDFYSKVVWGDLDVLFIDMPPGTGDVPLTVYQSIPIDGIVVVTSPQDLVGLIVAKAVDLARKMNIPIIGIVENMSYMECPCCQQKIHPFGEGRLEEYAMQYQLEVLDRLPIQTSLAQCADDGLFAEATGPFLHRTINQIQAQLFAIEE